MRPEHIRKYCQIDKETEDLLRGAFQTMNLSVRSYDRILKVARTIADLKGRKMISLTDAAEAVQYKCGSEMFR